MKVREIIEVLAKEYPLSMAMSWDNSGLQVGRLDREVQKVLVALDATDEVIEACIEQNVQLLVTHHPLMLSGIRNVTEADLHGRKVLKLIEHGIVHYAMHTNYDVVQMRELAEKAMQLEDTEILEVTGNSEDGTPYGIGCVGKLPMRMTARACCEQVKKAFGLENVVLFGDPEQMAEKIALSPGSGKSMIGCSLAKQADILVTGDIGHHDGLDAVDQGMSVIDAGHYGIEHIFIAQIIEYLKQEFPKTEVEGIWQKPYIYV